MREKNDNIQLEETTTVQTNYFEDFNSTATQVESTMKNSGVEG
jgi:hypothetical protein